jgi:hypothetical protein
MSQNILLCMIHRLYGNNDHVSQAIEPGQVLGGIVGGLIDTAGIQESKQRRFGSGELILPGVSSARLKPMADFRFVGPGQVFDDRGLAALSLAKQPNHGQRGALPKVLPPVLKFLLMVVEFDQAFEGA